MPSLTRSFAAAAFACLAIAPCALAEDGHVALFKNVTGPVRVLRKDAAVDATPGLPLFVSDRVVSGANGAAGIVFKDGTLLTVGNASEIALREYVFEPKEGRFDFSVHLAKGNAIYSSGKIGKLAPESVKVDTPTATIGVRGTRFIVTAE